MTKHRLLLVVAFLTAACVASAVPTPTSKGQMPIGPVHMTFGNGNKLIDNKLSLNDVVMTSKDYDLQAATVVADMVPDRGRARRQVFRLKDRCPG